MKLFLPLSLWHLRGSTTAYSRVAAHLRSNQAGGTSGSGSQLRSTRRLRPLCLMTSHHWYVSHYDGTLKKSLCCAEMVSSPSSLAASDWLVLLMCNAYWPAPRDSTSLVGDRPPSRRITRFHTVNFVEPVYASTDERIDVFGGYRRNVDQDVQIQAKSRQYPLALLLSSFPSNTTNLTIVAIHDYNSQSVSILHI
ncbi:hypothetical protein F4777DRAFT_5981 [Nemania sp. FL0916]|nr:hypothetical protein F4777DRAFT_5981 [Nemania sp. FL0916]